MDPKIVENWLKVLNNSLSYEGALGWEEKLASWLETQRATDAPLRSIRRTEVRLASIREALRLVGAPA